MERQPTRREFLKAAGVAGVCCSAALPVLGAPAGPPAMSAAPDHFIPADKKLDPQWVAALTAKGQKAFYQGEELERIGMPIGGICAGQLYLSGDGRLVHWDIFNRGYNTSVTNVYPAGPKPAQVVAQGFAIQVASGGKTVVRALDRTGFPGARFCGEYPIGAVEYQDAACPVAVTLEAFSPFIPLDANDSALPATVMQFTVKNTSPQAVEAILAGWLENAVCLNSDEAFAPVRRNEVLRQLGLTILQGSARKSAEKTPDAAGKLEDQADFGSLGLAVLGDGAEVLATAALPCAGVAPAADLRQGRRKKKRAPAPPPPAPAGKILTGGQWAELLFGAEGLGAGKRDAEQPAAEMLCGAAGRKLSLAPGQEARVIFVVTWCFPNLGLPKNLKKLGVRHGNHYANRFADAAAVARYVGDNFARLDGQTRLWRRTWYDSSLPHWLLDRLFSTTSTLATTTCQRWANGRFWAWEGGGCCHGTCGHVWNYAHAVARLFPELERSVREMQDYNPKAGFNPKTGAIIFRGEDFDIWAGDSQAGYPLKVLREHQMSADGGFLKRLWPQVRKSIEFLIREDGNADGLLEGQQHNTYDINFFGANTMVGSLYLAALRAGEEMAREAGDAEFAATCRKVFESGRKLSVERLFNGEYFIQQVDLAKHPKHQYADGCLADQLFGQGWAHQVALGYVYPKETVEAALRSIWKYAWAPDIAPQNKAHPPQRWFAMPKEAGLFTCTWPKSKHLGKDSVLYRDEVWTGIEYQVAGHMVWEGMLTEALAICRAIHDRYHPAKRNPWNEIECGDHYARGMASYGVFLALCGFEYDGPKRRLGLAPKLAPEDFRAAFTAAEGWGTLAQSRRGGAQTDRVEVRWGKLPLQTLVVELPEGARLKTADATLAGKPVTVNAAQDGRRVTLTLPEATVIETGQALEVRVEA